MKAKRIICLLLALATVASAAACGETAGGYAKVGAPDYSNATGQIDLDCWLSPKASDEAFQTYADCGYNMLHIGNDSVALPVSSTVDSRGLSSAQINKVNADVDRYFTLGEKYGIRCILSMNARNMNQTEYTDFSFIDSVLAPTLKKWYNTDTFYGYMPCDEPRLVDLPITSKQNAEGVEKRYSRIIDWIEQDYTYFNSYYPGKKFEIVMLNTICGPSAVGQSFKDGYEMFDFFCDNFLSGLTPDQRVMSVDSYPYTTDRNGEIYNRGNYAQTCEYYAIKSTEMDADRWTYTQAHVNMINPEQVTYQYYTGMAYGFSHFITYCYGGEVWNQTQFLMSDAGEKTALWYYYQRAHQDIKRMEKVYLQFANNWKGAIATTGTQRDAKYVCGFKDNKYLLESYDGIKSFKATQDALIGIMQDENGYDGYMITNQVEAVTNYRNVVEVTFDGADKALVYEGGKEEPYVATLDGGEFKIDLPTGGGAFVIPYKEA